LRLLLVHAHLLIPFPRYHRAVPPVILRGHTTEKDLLTLASIKDSLVRAFTIVNLWR
jgi:hypothetical protein